jgi:hypothetical protein
MHRVHLFSGTLEAILERPQGVVEALEEGEAFFHSSLE